MPVEASQRLRKVLGHGLIKLFRLSLRYCCTPLVIWLNGVIWRSESVLIAVERRWRRHDLSTMAQYLVKWFSGVRKGRRCPPLAFSHHTDRTSASEDALGKGQVKLLFAVA